MLAVDNLNLEVKDGEFVCFLGPSGCGKTTTLRCISGLERQDSGNIYIDDTVVNNLAPAERDIAMVFQFPVLYPGMSVRDNLAFPLQQRGLPKSEITKRVDDTLAILDLQHAATRDSSDLNTGERQRAAIGRAIVRNPKVLLLDEALTNLGTKLKVSMITELKKLHEKLRQTIVYVTHDQAEALMMADRIAVMDLGHLKQYDTPEKLYVNPVNLFVAGFVGSPPMNLIEASIDKGKGRVNFAGSTMAEADYTMTFGRLDGVSDFVIGFRPEDVMVHRMCSNTSHLKGKVDVAEFTESGSMLDITVGTEVIKAMSDGSAAFDYGQQVCLEFKRTYAFNKESGASIAG
jgi:multiple sugar transport system ATP-binding protein